MFKKTVFVHFILSLLFFSGLLRAEESIGTFSQNERILIVAPHPDDESLGLGGVLQHAVSAGADIRVLYLTNGELNEVASIFYQKRPLLLRADFIKNGLIRKREATEAMAFLGLGAEKLVFFGYPDGGMLNIWLKYWGNSNPFRSLFTRINKVPYKDDFSVGNYYRGDEIVRDLEKILLSFQPARIFVTAPFDLNTDHQAAYLYLEVALLNLGEQMTPKPAVHLYVIHAHQWPQPKKFVPEAALQVPSHIEWAQDVRWRQVPLSIGESKKKAEAILKYKSQIAYKKNFLLAFARSNEIVADYPKEKLVPMAVPASGTDALFKASARNGDVLYKIYGKELWVQIPLSNMLDEMGVLSSYVFSYRRGFLFSDMTKLSFKLFGNKIFVYDGFKIFYDPGLVYRFEKDRIFIRVPMRVLKNPDHLFVSTRNAKEGMSLDFGAWKLLEIVKSS